MANQTERGATSVLKTENYQWIPFPIPGATGNLEAAILNADIELGAIVAVLRMPPGARIPAHYHKQSREEFYVLEGDFINKGETYAAGAFFAVRPLDVHGPHETQNGCLLMFMQSTEVDPTDFFIDENDSANRRQFRVEFQFHDALPMPLIEKEYERLDELKADGIFIALDLKPDKSGGTLQMRGRSKDEVEIAVQSLPLYPFADWSIFDEPTR